MAEKKMKSSLGRRPRRPRKMTLAKEMKMREDLAKEGHTLREADSIIAGAKRSLHGASPPFLPGETPRRKKKTQRQLENEMFGIKKRKKK